MKILVTGAHGFLAKNLIEHIKRDRNDITLLLSTRDTPAQELNRLIEKADFIYHLAGVNRTTNPEDFIVGNSNLTSTITKKLIELEKRTPIVYSSSTQATLDNDYARSKLAAEKALEKYSQTTNANIYIYRLTNLFGKWSKPNYNSVVSTWCYNVSRDIPLNNNAPSKQLTLAYVDDVIADFLEHLKMKPRRTKKHYEPSITTTLTLEELENKIKSYKDSRSNLDVTKLGCSFTKKLYSTYLSYLPEDSFSYTLKENIDERGSFTEFIKTHNSGQISLSTSKPGVTRGNHFHHTKNEKFLVIKGSATIRFRKINTDKVIEYKVSSEKKEVIDVPVGYTHNITNTGEDEMILLLWANEAFDPNNPDTNFLKV